MVIVRDPIIRDQTKNLSNIIKRDKNLLSPKIGSKDEEHEVIEKFKKPQSVTEIKPATEPNTESETSMKPVIETKVCEVKTVPDIKSGPEIKSTVDPKISETKSATQHIKETFPKKIAERISYISETKRPTINDPKLTNNNKDINNYVTKTVKHLSRNPITGEGLPDTSFGQRKSNRKDGNPLLGTGYNPKSMRTW